MLGLDAFNTNLINSLWASVPNSDINQEVILVCGYYFLAQKIHFLAPKTKMRNPNLSKNIPIELI